MSMKTQLPSNLRCFRSVDDKCLTHGGPMPAGSQCSTNKVLRDVADHRSMQFRLYGDNRDKPLGIGPRSAWLLPYTTRNAEQIEADLRVDYEDFEDEVGGPTFVHLVREEFAELVKERDLRKAREEAIQAAALLVNMVEVIDEQIADGETETFL